MNKMTNLRVRGFALIESLIAFLVVAAGLLALAPLFSDMMGGGGLAKARAEALELAKGQNELLRAYALKAQFDQDVVSGALASNDPRRNGKNAVFDMTWTVTNPTGGAKYKNVATNVTWTDPQDGAQTIRVPTRIHFNDPALSAAISYQALCKQDPAQCKGLNSPWTSGYEGPHPSTDDQIEIGSEDDNQGTTATTDDVTIKRYDGGNVEIIHNGQVRFTAFGGIVHRIKGRVWLTPDARSVLDPSNTVANRLRVMAGSPAWCLFPICDGPNGACAITDSSNNPYPLGSYVCYVSGDCSHGGAGCPCIQCAEGETGACQSCVNGLDPSFRNRNLNGGWYGPVGSFGLRLNPDDQVCTFDTIGGGGSVRLTPARNYASVRVSSAGAPASCTASGVTSAIETRLDPWPDDRYNDYQPDQDQPIGPIELDTTRRHRGFCVSGTPKGTTANEGMNASFSYQDFVIGTKQQASNCNALAETIRSNFQGNYCNRLPGAGFSQYLAPSEVGRALEAASENKSLPENLSYGSACAQ